MAGALLALAMWGGRRLKLPAPRRNLLGMTSRQRLKRSDSSEFVTAPVVLCGTFGAWNSFQFRNAVAGNRPIATSDVTQRLRLLTYRSKEFWE